MTCEGARGPRRTVARAPGRVCHCGRMATRRARIDVVAVLAGVAMSVVALVQLFLPSPVGLADNGDYTRLVCHVGIAQAHAPGDFRDRAQFVTFVLHRGPPPASVPCNYWSPAVVPVWLAAHLTPVFGRSGTLDLRLLAVGYALLLGAAFGLLISALPRAPRVRVPAAAVGILALGDFAFVEYFASAYSEALGLVALLATVGLLIRCWGAKRVGPGLLGATTLAAVVLVSTKPQYGPLALVLGAALLVRPLVVDRAAPWRGSRLLHVVAAVVVVGVGAVTIHATPKQFGAVNRYDAFFYELLGHSPDPAADLRSFGLPPTLAPYAGTSWYSAHNASHTAAWPHQLTHLTYARLAAFYATHPDRAARLAGRGLRAAATPHLDYLGNYPAGHRGSPIACRLCLGSTFTNTFRSSAVVWIPLLWLLALGFGLVSLRSRLRRTRALGGGLLLTTAIAVTTFAAALLGEGSYEVGRHLFLTDASSALLVVLLVATLCGRFTRPERPVEGARD